MKLTSKKPKGPSVPRIPFARFGGRKMWLAMFIIATAYAAGSLKPELLSAELMALVGSIYAVFCGGNVVATAVAGRGPKQKDGSVLETAEPATMGDILGLRNLIMNQQGQLSAITAATETNNQALVFLVNYVQGNFPQAAAQAEA